MIRKQDWENTEIQTRPRLTKTTKGSIPTKAGAKITIPLEKQKQLWMVALVTLKYENEFLREEIRYVREENKSLRRQIAKSIIQRQEYEHLLDVHLKDKTAISLNDYIDTYLTGHEKRELSEGRKILEQEWWQSVQTGEMSKIKYYRLINNMDQKALAEKMGTKQANISRIEQIGYKPRIKTLERLAETFNLSPKDLI